MFRNLNEVDKYFVYQYHHLDDLSFLRQPERVFADHNIVNPPVQEWLLKVANLLSNHGWEGDGEIKIMWFPPFIPIADEDTWGAYAWTVKQNNDGTTFIASPTELPFERLLAQNSNQEAQSDRIPIGKVRSEYQILVKDLTKLLTELDIDLEALAKLTTRTEQIRVALLERTQGKMIQILSTFLDECYLQLLIDVITEGNRSGLKLRKASVKLDPGNYLPEDADYHNDNPDVEAWFTLRGLVTDMWRDYKFQPFPDKIEMLFRPVEFKPNEESIFVLRQHVCLRNCIQHHEGNLDSRELERLGRKSVNLKGQSSTTVNIKAGQPISIPFEELQWFDQTLRSLGADFEQHVEKRLVGQYYVAPEQ
jgi:hypothetical protein